MPASIEVDSSVGPLRPHGAPAAPAAVAPRAQYPRQMRIALLSDTHLPASIADLDALGPQPAEFLASCDLILHGGDVILPSVLDWCAQFAEVRCAGGNHDHFADERMKPIQHLEVHGWRIGVIHDLEGIPHGIRTVAELKRRVFDDAALDLVLSGDSHYERLEYRAGTLFMDSGSPVFPHHRSTRLGAMGLLELERDGVRARIVPLGETPGAPNPTTASELSFDRSGVLSVSVDGQPLEHDGSEPIGFRPRQAPPLPV